MNRLLPAKLFVLALAVIFGCSGPRPTRPIEREMPDDFPYHSAEDILFHLSLQGDTLHSFRAKGSAAIRTPEQGGQFSVDMQSRRRDSTFVSISPGLGIEAARALMTPDSFYFYDRLKNRLVYGAILDAGDVLPHPFATEDVFQNLLGLVVPKRSVDWEVRVNSTYYHLIDAYGTRTYVIDPALWRVTRYEERDASGTLLEEYVFSEFDTFDGVILPRRVVFRRPSEESTASIYYRSLSLNPENLSFHLGVRASAERVQAGG